MAWIFIAYRHSEGMKLGGIIYLYDISQTRLQTPRKAFSKFKKLAVESGVKNSILATTKWNDIQPSASEEREKELDAYWKEMPSQESKSFRFENTRDSAWAIVDVILGKFMVPFIYICSHNLNNETSFIGSKPHLCE